MQIRVNLTLNGERRSHVNTYRLSYERTEGRTFVTDWELVGLEPFSGRAEDGVRAFLAAVGEGDFVRAAGLSDIWTLSASARSRAVQELYLGLLDPPVITVGEITRQGENFLAEFAADGLSRQLIFAPVTAEGGYRFSVRQATDLSTPEATLQSYLAAYAAFDADGLLATLTGFTEEDALMVRELMAALKELFGEAGIRVEMTYLGFERTSEEEDRVSGILSAETRMTAAGLEQVSPLSMEVELVRVDGEWKIAGAVMPDLPVDPDPDPQPFEPDLSSPERTLESYFAALNTHSADNILSVFTFEGLTAAQEEAVRQYYADVTDRDSLLGYVYEAGYPMTVFAAGADYAEFSLDYWVTAGGRYELSGVVYPDVIRTSEGWKLLPENYTFEQLGVPRPDYSDLSPKHGLLRYLEILPCGDAELILDCFDLTGLTASEEASFRQTIDDYALNTWNTYVFEFGIYLQKGDKEAEIEAHLEVNGNPVMMNFTMTLGEDGVWRILARTQTHMYEEGAIASSFLQPTVQSFFSAFGAADREALEDLLTPDLPDYQRALLGVMNDEMDRVMRSGQQISVLLDSFQLFDGNETWCAGQMEGTLTVDGGEPSPLAFGFEATMTGDTWRFSTLSFDEGPVLPAAPATDFRPDSSTMEKLLTSYVAALNTRDLENLFSLLWTEDLTALQMSCVQSFYQNENNFDWMLQRQYWYAGRTTLFGSEAAGYEEDEVSLIVSGPNWNMALYRLDFIQTEEGWRVLPDSAAFNDHWPESVRPDWSHLSPKHAVAHYLDLLEYGDREGALACLDLTGLSEEALENYRFSVTSLIGVGLRHVIATSPGDTLFRAEYRSEAELTLSFEDYSSLVEIRLTRGEDGVWRLVPNPELMLGFYPD